MNKTKILNFLLRKENASIPIAIVNTQVSCIVPFIFGDNKYSMTSHFLGYPIASRELETNKTSLDHMIYHVSTAGKSEVC